MNILKKLIKNKWLQYIVEPWRMIVAFDRHILSIVPDKLFLKCLYRCRLGKRLNLKNPRTFYEKINWLKIYDRKPEYSLLVDKYIAKQYVGKIIGCEYIIPLLGVWERFEDIDFDKLPNQFVLKCSHSSGDVVICKDRNIFDIETARKKITTFLKQDFYHIAREWPYKNVKRRIIAEKYIEDSATGELRDYKVFTFNGIPRVMLVASHRQDKTQETTFDYFDTEYNHLNIKQGHPNSIVLPQKPKNFDKMISLAEKLSQGIPQVRVDYYEANGNLYFGELTFSDAGGFDTFEPEEWDRIFGDWIQLPQKTN